MCFFVSLQYLCSNDAFFIDSRHMTSNLYIKPLKRGKTTIILSVQLDNYILEKNRKKKEICHGLTTQNNQIMSFRHCPFRSELIVFNLSSPLPARQKMCKLTNISLTLQYVISMDMTNWKIPEGITMAIKISFKQDMFKNCEFRTLSFSQLSSGAS